MSQLKKYKLIIIEPSPVIQQGLKLLLEQDHDFVVLNLYADIQEFQSDKKTSVADSYLINPAVIGFHKEFAVRSLFTDYPDCLLIAIIYNYVDTGTLNGFDGAIDIYNNSTIILRKLQEIVKNHRQNQTSSSDNTDLSDREKEILASIAKGLTNKEIAEKHHISTHTVISHRKNITRKTGIKTVAGLTLYAVFNNLIRQDELL